MKSIIDEYSRLIPFLRTVLPGIYDLFLITPMEGKLTVQERSDWSSPNEKIVADTLSKYIKEHERSGSYPSYDEEVIISHQRMYRGYFYYLKDEEKLTGIFCILMECEGLMKTLSIINDILGENFGTEEEKVELEDIPKMVLRFCDDPEQLTINDKKELFLDLYDAGVFRLKGAVSKVAEAIGMSEKSAYRYLSEIRKKRQ